MKEKELLKNDPITIAIDKCNVILKGLDLRVGKITAIRKPVKPYSIYKGKLYTDETLDKVDDLEETE